METAQKKPFISRIVPVAVAVTLIAGAVLVPLRVPAESISALQTHYAQLQQQEQQLQSQIASQSATIQNNQAQANVLGAQIAVTQQQMSVLQQQVAMINASVQAKQDQIADTQAQIDSNMALLQKRLRALYESGHSTFLDVILSSNSISDFLQRVEIVRAVSSHDQQIIDNLKKAQAQMQADQQSLQKTQQSLQQAQGTMAAKQDVLNAQLTQQNQLISQAQANLQAAQKQSASVSTQEAQTYSQISAAFAAQAAAARAAATKSAAQSSGSSVSTGTSASIAVGGGNFDASVRAYQGTVAQVAAQYGVTSYVNLILAVIQQESDGQGNDPMQSLGGSSGTSMDSIVAGIQELKLDLQMAGVSSPSDIAHIELALQGYNFGEGFISWAQKNGGYSLENASSYSKMQASQLGWSGYGDPSYVPHVLRYYTLA